MSNIIAFPTEEPPVETHERSRFVKDGDAPGRWYYVDGDLL